MAMFSTDLHGGGFLAPVANFFARVGTFLTHSSHAHSRLQRAEELAAMTDDQLADLGITRTQIVNHVYQDVMYL